MGRLSITSVALISSSCHLALLLYGEHHDRTSVALKYTDVDFDVFSDAADSVALGSSPFDRATYRYTPLLAFLLLPGSIWNRIWGKVVFCTCDVLVGLISYCIVSSFQNGGDDKRKRNKRREKAAGSGEGVAVWSAATWLLNPMAIVVSSRGNAESVVALAVLTSLFLVLRRSPLLGGFVYGTAVHFKIYPVIYCASFYFAFGTSDVASDRRSRVWRLFAPNADRLKFVASSVFSFLALTLFFYQLYGDKYLEEAFLHHFRRSDSRHNFSPYFYLLYLSAGERSIGWLSLVAFVPQALLVAAVSLRYSDRRHLPFALFLETLAFVAYNKVCTSQYFLWFLCLLPTFIGRIACDWTNGLKVLVLWLSSQAAWLYAAYSIEFQAMDAFIYVWIASLGFLLSNMYVIRFLVHSYQF